MRNSQLAQLDYLITCQIHKPCGNVEVARERDKSAERKCDSQLPAPVAEGCESHFNCVLIP